MSYSVRMKGRRLLVILLSAVIAFTMMPGLGLLDVEKAHAAGEVVVGDEWISVDNEGTLTDFNDLGDYPKRIIIPKSLNGVEIKKIGDTAFKNAQIEYVGFETGSLVTEIGSYAFSGCALKGVSLPAKLTTIKDRAFESNPGIGELLLEDNCPALTKIGDHAFYQAGLTKLSLPQGLTTIGKYTFCENTNLKGTVKIKEYVTEIGEGAFSANTSDLKLDLTDHTPGKFKTTWGISNALGAELIWSTENQIENNTPFLFSVIGEGDNAKGIIHGLKSGLASNTTWEYWDNYTRTLTIPCEIAGHHVDELSYGVFAGAEAGSRRAIKHITFTDDTDEKKHTITELPQGIAHGVPNLEKFTNTPASVKTIRTGAFGYVKNGSSFELVFPGVTKMEGNSVSYMFGQLKKITLESDSVTSLSFSQYMRELSEIRLPNMTKDMTKTFVKNAPWGADRAKVIWKDGAETPAPLIWDATGTWLFNQNSANHEIQGYAGPSGSEVPLNVPGTLTDANEKTYTIKQIGTWGNNIFEGMEGTPEKKFSKVTFDKNITIIYGAFRGVKLGSVDLKNSKLQRIDGWAFSGCGIEGTLTLPETVTRMGGCAFNENPGITGKVTIPGNVTFLEDSTFRSCPGINEFELLLYKERDSDPEGYNKHNKTYLKATIDVTKGQPWDAPNVGKNVFYQDQPQPQPRSMVEYDTVNNKAVIKIRAFTTHAFYIVKDIVANSKMPPIENLAKAQSNGKRNPTTAEMVVSSKSTTAQNGGNGKYGMTMTYGNQKDETDEETYPYEVDVNAFKTLTYHANGGGGTAPTAGEPYVPGYTPQMAEQGGMTKAGYTFVGWTEKADGSGTVHKAKQKTYTMPAADATLFAKWTANDNDVTLKANGGVFKNETDTMTMKLKTDQNILGKAEVPKKEGYVFDGWSRNEGGEKDDSITVPAGGITVYATWKEGGSTAILDANGGKFSNNNTDKLIEGTTGEPLSTLSENPTREGYTFNGWSDDENASSGIITALPAGSATRLYATWQINQYETTFNANGGSFEGEETKRITANYNTEFASLEGLSEPTREGHNFMGWATTEDVQTANITTVPAEAKTVYAVWAKKNDITVTFDANGGVFGVGETATTTRSTENTTYEDELDRLFDYDEPERRYFTFKGWATTSGATEADIFTVPAESRTVYAVWTAIPASDDEKTAAAAALSAAKDNLNATAVSTDGKDVADTDKWVTQEEHDAFDTVIKEVDDLLKKDSVTQEKLASAVEKLNATQEEFNSAKKQGTKDTEDARAALEASIKAGEAKIAGEKKDGFTPETVKALTDAIAKGKTVLAKADATKDEMDKAKTDIDNAVKNLKDMSQIDDPNVVIPGEVGPDNPAPAAAVDKLITTGNSDKDMKGATYAPLKLNSKSQTKNSIKLKWSKVKGAKQYVVYGNQCGTKNKMKKLATVKGTSYNVKKILNKKLKKGIYYKLTVVAVNGNKALAISKTIHECTKGHKKYDNYKSVNVDKKVIAKAKKLKKGKTLALKAKAVVPKGKKVQQHAKMRYESSNKKIATVSKTGKVKAVKKGSCFVYCYAQNGIAKKVKITVK